MKLSPLSRAGASVEAVPSLPEVHRSVKVPKGGGNCLGILRMLFAFSGSDFLVAVGYMDPGTGP